MAQVIVNNNQRKLVWQARRCKKCNKSMITNRDLTLCGPCQDAITSCDIIFREFEHHKSLKLFEQLCGVHGYGIIEVEKITLIRRENGEVVIEKKLEMNEVLWPESDKWTHYRLYLKGRAQSGKKD